MEHRGGVHDGVETFSSDVEAGETVVESSEAADTVIDDSSGESQWPQHFAGKGKAKG